MKHDSESADAGKDNVNRLLGTRQMIRAAAVTILLAAVVLCTESVHAFRVLDVSGLGLGIGRWDAAPHFVDGVERSLDGGLRYSVTGGSYEAFRDALSWETTPPSVPDFQRAIEQAFAAWEAVDPATGLGTNLRFVPDLDTPVFAEPVESDSFRLNRGAEIDLLAQPTSDPRLFGNVVVFGDPNVNSVTLTSGVANYAAAVHAGADIYINSSRMWTIGRFQNLLTKEIGLALPLANVDVYHEVDSGGVRSRFYDDNYDNTNSASALATLTNSFGELIDPLDPDNSPALALYDVCMPTDRNDPFSIFSCKGNPGIDTPGADLLMETTPNTGFPPRWPSGPQNDDFAGRQFLYPLIGTPGDFDGDTLLTTRDIDLLSAEIEATEPRLWFDLNNDDSVDADDLSFWVTDLKETFVGDTDLDGQVNAADLNSLAINWQVDDATSWTQGDFDGDGSVNASDLNDLALDWQSGVAQVATIVPEPSTTVLLLLGGAVILSGRRRRLR